MRSYAGLTKLVGLVLLVTIVAFGGFNRVNVFAGAALQSTAEASAAATDNAATPAATTSAATEVATTAANSAATVTYPPCVPGAAVVTQAATTGMEASATEAATASASAEATSAATPNANPGYLGVRGEQVDDCGVIIRVVIENQPAAKAGLLVDDVIVAVDGKATPSLIETRDAIAVHVPGERVTLTIQRKGQQLDVAVTLGTKPTDTTAPVGTLATESATESAPAAATLAATVAGQ